MGAGMQSLQLRLFDDREALIAERLQSGGRSNFRTQLLKWVGNKQRVAPQIISCFPPKFGTYYEPFLGSAGVLGVLAPPAGFGSDTFEPLVGIWKTLAKRPKLLKKWYADRHIGVAADEDKIAHYEAIKANYNRRPNAADLLFISRACYGGVVRFRKRDGGISTPCGQHQPISPESFSTRVDIWRERVGHIEFSCLDFRDAMANAGRGDLIYCDPPYVDSQSILYGAQSFKLDDLFSEIEHAKHRGVFVAMSIDGTKKSGRHYCNVEIPESLFKREVVIDCGRSMLRRFQREGGDLGDEVVKDRLLLTY